MRLGVEVFFLTLLSRNKKKIYLDSLLVSVELGVGEASTVEILRYVILGFFDRDLEVLDAVTRIAECEAEEACVETQVRISRIEPEAFLERFERVLVELVALFLVLLLYELVGELHESHPLVEVGLHFVRVELLRATELVERGLVLMVGGVFDSLANELIVLGRFVEFVHLFEDKEVRESLVVFSKADVPVGAVLVDEGREEVTEVFLGDEFRQDVDSLLVFALHEEGDAISEISELLELFLIDVEVVRATEGVERVVVVSHFDLNFGQFVE